jgi:hypothetical protein
VNHHTVSEFWRRYDSLPEQVRLLADKSFELLKADPHHPSLHLKKVTGDLWSDRVGRGYRAPGTSEGAPIVWFWIGSHAEYDRLIR